MRTIHQIKNLPISELTDEEIAKAACYRLNAKFAMLVYMDQDGKSYFLGKWKDKQGKQLWNRLLEAWVNKFGPMRKLEDLEN